MNYYEILGISPNATEAEIKEAFHKKAMMCHPDRYQNPKLKKQKEEEFKAINQAYRSLLGKDGGFSSAYHRTYTNKPKEEHDGKFYYDRANMHYRRGKYQSAIADCEQAISRGYKKAYYLRAQSKTYLNDYKGVIEDCTQAIRFEPDNDAAYNDRGSAKFLLHQYREAIEDYTQAIKLSPDAFYYRNRGNAKRALQDYAGAIDDYREAVSLAPEDGESWEKIRECTQKLESTYYDRAKNYAEKREWKKAVKEYDQIISLTPKAIYFFKRAYAKNTLGDYKGAIEDYSESIRLKPDDAVAYNNRGCAKKSLYQYKGAIEDYTQAIKLSPDSLYYRNRGNAKRALQNYAGAIDDYCEAVCLDPEDTAFWNILRECTQKPEDTYYDQPKNEAEKRAWQKVVKKYDQIISLTPRAIYFFKRAYAKNMLEDYKGAIEDYTQAIKLDSAYIEAYTGRGETYKDLQKYDKTIADYKKAISLNTKDTAGRHRLTEIYFQIIRNQLLQQDFKRARKYVKQALTFNAENREQLVETYMDYITKVMAQGKYNYAISIYKEVITLWPDYAKWARRQIDHINKIREYLSNRKAL